MVAVLLVNRLRRWRSIETKLGQSYMPVYSLAT